MNTVSISDRSVFFLFGFVHFFSITNKTSPAKEVQPPQKHAGSTVEQKLDPQYGTVQT